MADNAFAASFVPMIRQPAIRVSRHFFPFAFLHFVILSTSFTTHASSLNITADQATILVNFVKPELDPDSQVLSSWSLDSGNCSTWVGLTCDSKGQVSQIDLPNQRLPGSISTYVGSLLSLTSLNLRSNRLRGSIPAALGNLVSLQVLDLSDNRLSGFIPSRILALGNMTVLNLSTNRLSGPLSNFSRSSLIQQLDLHSNRLNATFPWSTFDLPSITYLDIASNSFQFRDNVFSLASKLPLLSFLNISNLGLVGPIPSQLASLTQITHLIAHHNSLSGPLPPEIKNLTRLQHLDLGSNHLSGTLAGTLPLPPSLTYLSLPGNSLSGDLNSALQGLTGLTYVDLSQNRFSGSFPPSLFSLARLEHASLALNNLDGRIPDSFESLPALAYLDLESNYFNGSIPASIASCQNLSVLSLANNSLTGEVPPSFWKSSALNLLDLSLNALNGTVPPLSTLSALAAISLTQNQFSGGIPGGLSTLWNLKIVLLDDNDWGGQLPGNLSQLASLQTFTCANCLLEGSIPPDMASSTSFLVLDLSGNRLTSSIPPPVVASLSLLYLDLSSNSLSGPIPDVFSPSQSLSLLDLHSNRLAGSLPSSLADLKNVSVISLAFNAISGPLPPSYGSLGFNGERNALRNLSMQSNLLAGSLPPQIGRLNSLLSLRLNNNSLTGTLPFELGNLTSLVVLDVSNNSFFGSIPASLGNLTNLQELSLSASGVSKAIPTLEGLPNLLKLDLSYNRLEGTLPQLPAAGGLITISLQYNFLSGNLSYLRGNFSFLQALLLGNNQLEGVIPSSTLDYFPRLYVLSLVSNRLSGPVPESLLSRPVLTVQLYGNSEICEGVAANSSLYVACQVPLSLEYAAQALCPGTTCTFNFTPSPFLYHLNNSCACSAPLTATLLLESPVFVLFTLNDSLRLSGELAGQLGLQETQVWIKSVVPSDGSKQIVTCQFFAAGGQLASSSVSRIISRLQNVTLSVYFGQATLLNYSLPPTIPPPLSPPPPVAAQVILTSRGPKTWLVVLLALGSATAAFACILAWIVCWRPPCMYGKLAKQTSFSIRVQDHFVKAVPLDLVRAATDNFSEGNVLGSGAYGTVYRGVAPGNQTWAVKRAKIVNEKGLRAFQNEVDVMSKMSHANLVRLLGFCDEASEQILIYDFMPNGTLRSQLKKKPQEAPPLSFDQRLDIALGAAEGLRYLHDFASPTIIHRDVKSENILLDDHLQAKISDFGLLKDNPLDLSSSEGIQTRVAGTPGYIDPQYYETFQVTTKSDVYSFGVVLLELITGRGPLLREVSSDGSQNPGGGNIIKLVDWLGSIEVDQTDLEEYVDPNIEYPAKAMRGLVEVALKCLKGRSVDRPTMEEVVLALAQVKSGLKEAARDGSAHGAPWSHHIGLKDVEITEESDAYVSLRDS